MARMLSHVASLIRGSVGGLTYTANQFHAIVMRARVSPVQPNTNYQTLLRTAAVQAEAQWKVLSESAKRNWGIFASTVSFSGPAGPYTVPGRSLYFGWAAFRTYLLMRGITFGTGTTSWPVTPGRLPSPGNVVMSAPLTGIGVTIDFLNTGLVTVNAVCVRSRSFNNSRNTWKGPWLSETLLSDENLLTGGAGSFTFTDLIAGQVYFARLLLVSYAGPVNVSLGVVVRFVATAAA